MVVQHNLSAMNSNRQLGITTGIQAKSSEKLSSGYKINRAADDAAGLAISEKMRRQIRGLSQGAENIQDGISMLQIGDGALEEVMDMLHRMTTLSVKAANDTLTKEDRSYIQQETNALLEEIDRIDSVTEFNNIRIFGNREIFLSNADGSPLIEGDIPFSSFSFADVNINKNAVFSSGSTANTLSLQAVINDSKSAANGKVYRMIYGDGSTSSSSVRFSFNNGGSTETRTANLTEFSIGSYVNNQGTVSRVFSYDKDGIKFDIKQTVTPNAVDKNYNIQYELENKGDIDLDMEFMFHVDTAYNNNDLCESYYTGGDRIKTTRVYVSDDYDKIQDGTGVYSDIPDSISIINRQEALAFSEKVEFTTPPDMLSIGQYHSIPDWGYYGPNMHLGASTENMDLGYSALWQDKDLSAGKTMSFSFKFGIAETKQDANLDHSEVKKSNKTTVLTEEAKQFWIQASSTVEDGMYISFGSIDQDTLGLTDLDVSKSVRARESIQKIKDAQGHVSKLRSHLGAQQNRLEHTYKNNRNAEENTTAAESRIRDTDMAAEMVRYSNNNILAQAGQSMLAQANQTNQGVLSLLQ